MNYDGISGDFHYILTQVTIHLYFANHKVTALLSLRLCERLYKNGVVEEDDGPWVALVFIPDKPHQ